jgi:hypothetical protein
MLINLTHIELNISRMDVNDIIILKGIASLAFLRLVFTGTVDTRRRDYWNVQDMDITDGRTLPHKRFLVPVLR